MGILRGIREDGILKTIGRYIFGAQDPDKDPAPDWIAKGRKAIAAGVGAVLGWVAGKVGLDLTGMAPALVDTLTNLVVVPAVGALFAWLARNKPTVEQLVIANEVLTVGAVNPAVVERKVAEVKDDMVFDGTLRERIRRRRND